MYINPYSSEAVTPGRKEHSRMFLMSQEVVYLLKLVSYFLLRITVLRNLKILQKNQNMKTTNCRDTKPLAMALLTFSHVMTFKVKGQGHSEM